MAAHVGRFALMPGCDLLLFDTVAGVCRMCGAPLPRGRRSWCGDECELAYARNHYWNVARQAAISRDHYACVKCGWDRHDFYAYDVFGNITPSGQLVLWSRTMLTSAAPDNWLEVNHITPRLGQGYGTGCWHHLSGLETLCHKCHVTVTRRQRRARAC